MLAGIAWESLPSQAQRLQANPKAWLQHVLPKAVLTGGLWGLVKYKPYMMPSKNIPLLPTSPQ